MKLIEVVIFMLPVVIPAVPIWFTLVIWLVSILRSVIALALAQLRYTVDSP